MKAMGPARFSLRSEHYHRSRGEVKPPRKKKLTRSLWTRTVHKASNKSSVKCQLIQVRWMWMGTIRLHQQHQQHHPQQKLCLFGCLQEVVSFAPRLDCIYLLISVTGHVTILQSSGLTFRYDSGLTMDTAHLTFAWNEPRLHRLHGVRQFGQHDHSAHTSSQSTEVSP